MPSIGSTSHEMPDVPGRSVPSSPTMASSGRAAVSPATIERLGGAVELGDHVGRRRLRASTTGRAARRRPASAGVAGLDGQAAGQRRSSSDARRPGSPRRRGPASSRHSPRARSTRTATMLMPAGRRRRRRRGCRGRAAARSRRRTAARRGCSRSAPPASPARRMATNAAARAAGEGSADSGRVGAARSIGQGTAPVSGARA